MSSNSPIILLIDLFLHPLSAIAQSIVLFIWIRTLYKHSKKEPITRPKSRSTTSNTTTTHQSKTDDTAIYNYVTNKKNKKQKETSPDITIETVGNDHENKILELSPSKSNSPTTTLPPPKELQLKTTASGSNSIPSHPPKELQLKTTTSGSNSIPSHPPNKAKKTLSDMQPIQKFLTTLCIVFGFVYVWGLTISIIISGSGSMCIFLVILLFAALQRVALYSYFMLRTYFAFKDSIYAISYQKMKCYVITFISIYVFIEILWIYVGFSNECDPHSRPLGSVIILSFLYEMSISFFCLKLATNRLVLLYTKTSSNNELSSSKQDTMDHHLNQLLNVSSKITVLTLAAMLSTIFNVLQGAMGLFTSGGTTIDTVFNSICLLLSFIVYQNRYNCLCKYPHICMVNCCTNHTKCVKCCCCVTQTKQ